ncbi:transport permease protein [Litchfieldella qijiaojingensis]|uniref:Transport permease protein n=1 Tax=Litchfieldella qijiaojingensis TaxID=980347 RepID=A0ABQ2Z7F9_9GAMM|nr:ABC transporter permease [Halomonas qijiaojingensis]GGY07451.1 transport permease protein [Halomonas qijiaojingensis]
MKLRRMLAIVLKELRQLRRDRLTFAMIVGIPVMQLVLFGYAINLDVRHLNAAVMDQADTARSRELVAQLEATQVIDLSYRVATPQEVDDLMGRGKINVAVVLPVDFETRLERGDRPALQLVVDGSDQVVQASARQLARFPVPDAEGWTEQVAPIEVVNFYNPERRAPVNTVPGLIGVILTMTMVLFTAIALVRERENGNLEMLIATPVSPWELTLGKVLPFVGIGLIQVTVVLVLGRWLFAVPVRGSLLELYLAALVFILASLSLGIFLSTLARSQFQAMQMAFFTFLPQILLSGFMFPFAGMPKVAQWLAELLPLTHFLRLVRGIMLRDAALLELWPALAALGVFTLVMLSVAVARTRKSLD